MIAKTIVWRAGLCRHVLLDAFGLTIKSPLAIPSVQTMTGPIIRSAVEADLESIRRIYEHDVLEGTASFEIDPPDLEAIRERWQMTG